MRAKFKNFRSWIVGCLIFLAGSFCSFGCFAGFVLSYVVWEDAQQAQALGEGAQVIVSQPTLISTSTPISSPVPTVEPTPGGPQIGPMMVFNEVPQTPETVSTPEIFITRIKIPKIGVDALVVSRGVEQNGDDSLILASPEKAAEVAHFSFSSLPGKGQPILINGHIAWIEEGRNVNGVFRQLGKLDPSVDSNIKIILSTSDGQEHHYIAIRRHFKSQMNDEEVDRLLDLKQNQERLILISCYWPYIEGQGYQDRIFIIAVPDKYG